MLREKVIPWIHNALGEYSVILAVAILLLVTGAVAYLERSFYRKLYVILSKKRRVWQLAFLQSFHAPFAVFIWVLAFSLGVILLTPYLEGSWVLDVIHTSRVIVYFTLFVWWVARLIDQSERVLMRPRPGKPPLDTTTLKAVAHLLRTLAVIAVGLVFMQVLEIPISGVLAFGGFGGIVVGFAGRDLLSNFFGGLMIFLDRPFVIGDWIRSPDKEIEGHVEHISWRLTRIRTLDKRPLFVPNSLFLTISVENPSRMSHRRIKVAVGLPLHDSEKLPKILKEIQERAIAHKEVDKTLPVLANLIGLVNLGSPALNIELNCFTKMTALDRFQNVQQELLMIIVETIEKHGSSIAIPWSWPSSS